MSAKLCKFGCGVMLTWDVAKNKFVEQDGKEHTRERCASLKLIPVSHSTSNYSSPTPEQELEAAVRALVAAIRRMKA
jgi:hypothetical protein